MTASRLPRFRADRRAPGRNVLGWLAAAVLVAAPGLAQSGDDPHAGHAAHEGHAAHSEHSAHAEHADPAAHLRYADEGQSEPAHDPHAHHRQAPAGDSSFAVTHVWQEPRAFHGTLGHDVESGRLFAVSHGPPANVHGPSVLYELDPDRRRVERQAVMPFEGVVAAPVLLDGWLYVGVDHRSKLYKVDVRPEGNFGEVVAEVGLPTLNELPHDNERDIVYRFPFVAFEGLAANDAGNLVTYAQNLAELVEVDPKSGAFLRRTGTIHGLAGLARLDPGADQDAPAEADERLLLVSHTDPAEAIFEDHVRRFMFRASHGLIPTQRNDSHDLVWVVIDGENGELLASHDDRDARARAGSVTLLRREPQRGTPFGTLTLLATGQEGILEVQWTPQRPRGPSVAAP